MICLPIEDRYGREATFGTALGHLLNRGLDYRSPPQARIICALLPE
jgi:hypothetical protein